VTAAAGARRSRLFFDVYVEDADETYRVAVAAGAESLEKPMDMPYGDRRATVLDPWGNNLADRDAHCKYPLPGLVPGIHALAAEIAKAPEDVDGRAKPGQ
jgi:glyoxalase/bleomycin resistance protein/dioxygenase superfamily protein